MSESTITAKGQTTVPQAIRDALQTTPGTKLHWNVMPNGTIFIRAKNKSIRALEGTVGAPKGRSIAIEDMNAWR